MSYFETWNTGRKLRVSGMLLLFGYTVTTMPALIDVLSGWTFRVIATEQAYINPLYMNPICIGPSLMVCGLSAFVYLWITHRKK